MDKYIRFDWAAKRMLRNKANFGVLEATKRNNSRTSFAYPLPFVALETFFIHVCAIYILYYYIAPI